MKKSILMQRKSIKTKLNNKKTINMDNTKEPIESGEDLRTLLDLIKNSTIVIVDDARTFTHEDAKEVLAQIKKEKGE